MFRVKILSAISALILATIFSHPASAHDEEMNAACGTMMADTAKAHEPSTEAFFEAAKARMLAKLTGQKRAVNQFFDHLKAWYLTPSDERQTPMHLLLPGMTATGKTTVALLALEELNLLPETFYFHVEKYSGDTGNIEAFGEDLFRAVETRGEVEGVTVTTVKKLKNPVIILDEMQKINTRNPKDGEPVGRAQANQIFEFLGNRGKLRVKNPAYDKLKYVVSNPDWYMEMPEGFKDKDKAEKKAMIQASRKEAEAILAKTPLQVQLDFTPSLVLIMLNLDNTYLGSNTANPENMTADEMHAETSKITPTDIRGGLLKLWRPEHVRRFGSRYISFITFSDAEFHEQMDKEVARAREAARARYKIDLEFSERLLKRVYSEGVIPTQGMVPLIDTVSLVTVDPLPTINARFRSLIADGAKVSAKVDIAKDDENYSEWTVTVDGEKQKPERFLIPSDFKNSLNLREEPLRSHVAIRLAARVAAGIRMYKGFPTLVRANSRTSGRDGLVQFENTVPENDFKLRSEMVAQISYYLAPFVMEQLIFGESSMMSASDVKSASSYAKHLAVTGMARDLLSVTLTTPPAPETPATAPAAAAAPALPKTELEAESTELIRVLKSAMETMARQAPKGFAIFGGERPGAEGDAEIILTESFKELNGFLKEQKRFIATLANALTQAVELDPETVENIFRETWSGDKNFVGQAAVTPAQRFLQDFETFKFNEPEQAAETAAVAADRAKLH